MRLRHQDTPDTPLTHVSGSHAAHDRVIYGPLYLHSVQTSTASMNPHGTPVLPWLPEAYDTYPLIPDGARERSPLGLCGLLYLAVRLRAHFQRIRTTESFLQLSTEGLTVPPV